MLRLVRDRSTISIASSGSIQLVVATSLTIAGCKDKACQSAESCGTEIVCPSWVGISQLDHDLYEPLPSFDALVPPHERFHLDYRRNYDGVTGEVTMGFSYGTGAKSIEIDMYSEVDGEVLGLCDADGYKISARTATWIVQDPFWRYQFVMSTTATWDPPILELPAETDVGTSWEIESTQTTAGADGATISRAISERLEIVSQEPIETTLGELEALVVETSQGHRLYYVEGAGLVQGSALIRDGDSYYGGP